MWGDNIPRNIFQIVPTFSLNVGNIWEIFWGTLSVPQIAIIDLNNVVLTSKRM
jgi:hypothetical protein